MARAGRKRKTGERTTSGRLRTTQEPVIPVFAFRRRADLFGGDNAYQPEAGYALGQLQFLGVITRRQLAAAIDALHSCQGARVVRAAVECIVMDDVLPPAFRDRAQAVRALQPGQDTKA